MTRFFGTDGVYPVKSSKFSIGDEIPSRKDLKRKVSSFMGIYGVYKPKGPTSNQILQKLKKITGEKKIGHAGTLDPLASGILVVGIGRPSTKKLGSLVKKEKEYLAKIKLGEKSTTDDSEGQKKRVEVSKIPTFSEIKKVISEFKGEIFQTPPVFSAIKIKGQEAYKLARKGKVPTLEPRKIEIKKIEILNYQWPYLTLRVVTGPGVYIRSLARDIGKKLSCGGYLAELERTRVGEFSKKNSLTVSEFKRYGKSC